VINALLALALLANAQLATANVTRNKLTLDGPVLVTMDFEVVEISQTGFT